jgi:hypothetical protein
MAPQAKKLEEVSALADYFFIAGVESSQVIDEKNIFSPAAAAAAATPPAPVDTTIEENKVLETDTRPTSSEGTADANKRRSRLSFDARKSISSMLGSESLTASNRSSATIKGYQAESTLLNDQDFDNALRKFAAERDNFLEENHFSAGTLPPASRTRKPKTQKQVGGMEENGGLRSGLGSIRRRISIMSNLKRQPSKRGKILFLGLRDSDKVQLRYELRNE